MNVWMIHEVNDEEIELLSNLSINNNLFIWDDGVVSQYDAIMKLKEHHNILAISSNIVNHATEQYRTSSQIPYESTSLSHQRWHERRDARAFMTWEQVKELSKICEIAAHGYNHSLLSSDVKRSQDFIDECFKIKSDFINRLNREPKTYVYPYNKSYYWTDAILHKMFNWTTYGAGRLDAKLLFAGKLKMELYV